MSEQVDYYVLTVMYLNAENLFICIGLTTRLSVKSQCSSNTVLTDLVCCWITKAMNAAVSALLERFLQGWQPPVSRTMERG